MLFSMFFYCSILLLVFRLFSYKNTTAQNSHDLLCRLLLNASNLQPVLKHAISVPLYIMFSERGLPLRLWIDNLKATSKI